MNKTEENQMNKLIELLGSKAFDNLLNQWDDNLGLITEMCEKLYLMDEGSVYREVLTNEDMILELDERAELYSTVVDIYRYEFSRSEKKDFCNEVDTVSTIQMDNYPSKENRDFFISILGLPCWATREEILNKIKEII